MPKEMVQDHNVAVVSYTWLVFFTDDGGNLHQFTVAEEEIVFLNILTLAYKAMDL
jgi:hypothetical protein